MKNKFRWFVLITVAIALLGAIWGYFQIFSSNTSFATKTKIIFIQGPMDVEELATMLKNDSVISNKSSFLLTCNIKNYTQIKRPGRYAVKQNSSNNTLANMFRSGSQAPLMIRFGTEKRMNELAGTLGRNLRPDSLAFANAFDEFSANNTMGISADCLPCLFLANTYETMWTTSPDEFLTRMISTYNQYWTEEKETLAKKLNLTKLEVCTLASIVKGETSKMDEAPKIAGLYLNRLRIGMKLQSDPTSVFGAGVDHVSRVTNQIRVQSRYNTYNFVGLPPGPISLVETTFLDAVLNAVQHDYIYMCAKADFSKYHNFSKTYAQHEEYAAQYHRELDARGIRAKSE